MKSFQTFAWAVYDLGDTAFSALFVTFFFPLFITEYMGGTATHVGLVFGLSMFFAGILVPYLGAVSDSMGRRIPFMVIFTVSCILCTALIAYVELWAALLLAFFANFFYHAAVDVYDALLVDITTRKNIGRVSGYGVALGYVGTLLSLGMATLILWNYGGESIESIRAMFPATAFFFLGFACITFFYVKDTKSTGIPLSVALRKGFSSLMHTFRTVKKHHTLWIFLIASFIYMDGMNTAIVFLYLYGRNQIGLEVAQFIPVYAAMALVAILGAWISGKLTDKYNPRIVLIWTLFVWVGVTLLLMSVQTYLVFLIAGCIGGAALGSVWTATRPMLVQLAPKKKMAELFGFQGLTEKFGGVLGPILFGFAVDTFSYQVALFVPLVFFLIGLVMFKWIPKN